MLSISQAKISDMPVVHNLAHEIWPVSYLEILGQAQLDYMLDKIYSLPSLLHQFEVLKHHFILVWEDETPIGFASFSPHSDDASAYHLNKIYVHPSQQGKNLGRRMLEYIIKEIKKAGAKALQLNVNRHNKALHFYEKQGFKIIRQEDIDIGSGYFMNDYVMELKLS
jgi:ribosomal protein S18 acetylase RimI-like enzyme